MSEQIYSIEDIRRIVSPIARRHGVDRVYLFGSYARGEANKQSDIDLCVDAASLRGMIAVGALYADLQEAFQKELDLITEKSLRYNTDERFLDRIRKEQVLVYEHN